MAAKVFFLMDAFSSDYLSKENTPFLYNCSKKGEYTKKIITGFGFCERAEIFTGISSVESNYISAIGFNPDHSPYKNISLLLKILNFFDKHVSIPLFRKILRRLLAILIYSFKHPLNPYQIPYEMLKYFSLTEDYFDSSVRNALKNESIFDIAKLNSKKIYDDSFTGLNKKNNGTDDDRLNMALENCSDDYALYLIYISIMDASGHKYGPKSNQVQQSLKSLDSKLEKFVTKFEKKLAGSSYVFLGDHGMTSIIERVNLIKILQGMDRLIMTSVNKDYIYFLDSTMLRVWVLNKNCKKAIEDYLASQSILIEKGIFYSTHMKKKPSKELGDIVWCANSGVLISPDFFHSQNENLKGMHGYLDPKEGGFGTCIKYGAVNHKVYEKRELHSVFDDLVDSVR
jgi:predicted AlkP superfamily pyrophosphatase or phosphodiesterase